jgi:subtilisin-like proprotein convertase family protein
MLCAMLWALAGALCVNAQVSETNSYSNVNKPVPDGNAAGLSDVRTINSAIANLSAVRVKVRITGEFNGDLYGYLRHIQGGVTNFCVLLNRVGRTASNPAGYGDAGLDILLDDSAGQGDIHLYETITNPPFGTPLTGVWKTDGRRVDPDVVLDTTARTATLSAFNGTAAGGEWTLYLADMASGGTNMLVSWELRFTGVATPAVTWATPADIVYGTALSGTQLNAASTVPGNFVYTPPVGTVLNAGSNQTLSVTFNPTDTGGYVPVTTNVSLNVLKHALTITALNTNKAYGAPLPVFGASYSGFVNGDTTNKLTTQAAVSTSAGAGSPTGGYSITASGSSSTNYTIAYVAGTLTVTPAALTITALNTNKVYGAPVPVLGAGYSGFVNGDTTNNLTAQAVLSTGATASSSPGGYTITASGASSTNYTIAYVPGTLNISKAASTNLVTSSRNPAPFGQSVTFTNALAAVAPGAGTPTGSVQFRIDGAAAGGPVALSGGAAIYSTSTLAHGNHTVVAEYAGDGNFFGVTNQLSPVELINSLPVAVGDTIQRDPTNSVKVSIATLLSNDTDADSDPITFLGVSVTSVNGGTVVSNAGWVTYTPAAGFTNIDTFFYTNSDGYGTPVAGLVTVNIRTSNGPSPNLTITNLGNGSFAVRGDGIPQRTYRLQYTTDTQNPTWNPLGSATADTSGFFLFIDTNGSSQRFYRSIYP